MGKGYCYVINLKFTGNLCLKLTVSNVKAIAKHHQHFASRVSTAQYVERIDEQKRSQDRARVYSVAEMGSGLVRVKFELVNITTVVTYINDNLTVR